MRSNSSQSVLVVGGGLGGLACACRLAAAGARVQVWEKNDSFGGKLQEMEVEGYRWDMGPSLLTMPHLLRQLFADVGRKLGDYLTLLPLATTCRYFWRDGTVIDEDADFWHEPEVRRFLSYAEGIYALSGEAFLHYPPSQFWRAFAWHSLPLLRHLPKVATFRTLAEEVDRHFTSPHLRQLFYRFATYNGSSPFRTPATFNIIPYVEHRYGGWYPQGGLRQVAVALTRLAEELGVELHAGRQAKSFDGRRVVDQRGESVAAEFVVCNQDALAAAQSWLGHLFRPNEKRRLLRPPLSSSGFVMFLGVAHRYSQLRHHNIFFSQDYRREFAQIFEEGALPDDPTIYISSTSRSEPGHAPEGCDNYFVLVNAPSLPPASYTPERVAAYGESVLARLEEHGLQGLRQRVQVRRVFSPADFARRDLTHNGSLYGWASHSISTSLLRPPLRHPRHRQLYFVGGTTHPGGGIPLVLLSGEMVAREILKG